MSAIEKEDWMAGILMSLLKWEIITGRYNADVNDFQGFLSGYDDDVSCGMCWAAASLDMHCNSCLQENGDYECCKEYDAWNSFLFENNKKAAEAMYQKLLKVADQIIDAEVIE